MDKTQYTRDGLTSLRSKQQSRVVATALLADPVETLLARLDGVKHRGDGSWQARCPAHEDGKPSLNVRRGNDGKCLVRCYAGCDAAAVCSAVGLSLADLFPASNPPGPTVGGQQGDADRLGPIVVEYPYPDADGVLRHRVTRHDPKTFRPWRRDGSGAWAMGGRIPHPYRLPELVAADPAEPVLVVEGEKDADALARLGFVATCNAGGAGKWSTDFAPFFAGRRVAVLPDNDDPGRAHAEQVARSLHPAAAEVRVVLLPGLPPKGDVSDWIAAGGTADVLRRLIAETAVWEPLAPAVRDDAPDGPEPWAPPVPLVAECAPDLDPGALPGAVGAWVEAAAVATQTPRALAATTALGVLAAALAKRVEVEVRDGWREPVNVYALCALPPGNRKTGVVQRAVAPLVAFEVEEAERIAPRAAIVAAMRDVEEQRLKKLKGQMASATDRTELLRLRGDVESITRQLLEDPELIPPAPPRLLAEDATPEALVSLMSDNGGAIAVVSDEGDVFEVMAGRFSRDGKSPNLGVFLKAHAGSDMPVDRIGRATKRLSRPALTLALAVQPDVVQGLAAKPGFRGRGLLGRFLWAVPPSTVGRRALKPPPVPAAVAVRWDRLIRGCLALTPGTDADGNPDPRTLAFSPAADDAMLLFESALEPRLGADGDLAHVADWGAKLAGLVARLAGLLHAAVAVESGSRPWEAEVGAETMAAAVGLADSFLIPHALAAFGAMGADPAVGQAHAALRRLASWGRPTFSRRDLHQDMRGTFRAADQLDPVLRLLEDHGFVRRLPAETEPGKPGRKPSPRFEVNPLWTARNPHNPHNPPAGCDSDASAAGCEDCEQSEEPCPFWTACGRLGPCDRRRAGEPCMAGEQEKEAA